METQLPGHRARVAVLVASAALALALDRRAERPQCGYGALREGDLVGVSGVWTVDNRLVAQGLQPFPPATPPGPSERTP
jgi:hypothetical protein